MGGDRRRPSGRRRCTGRPTRSRRSPRSWPRRSPRRWASRSRTPAAGSAAGVGTLRQYAELGPLRGGRTLHGDDGRGRLHDARSRAAWSPRSPRGTTRWRSPAACSARPWSPATWCSTSPASGPRRRAGCWPALLDEALPAGVLSLLTGGRRGGRGAGRAGRWTWSPTSAPPRPAGRSPPPAPRTGAKVLLENGGSDPLVVDAGVDPAWAAEQAALGAFANAGQICVAVERIYVHRDVAEDFVAALVERAEALPSGRAGTRAPSWARWSTGGTATTCTGRSRAAVAAGARRAHRRGAAGRAGRVLPGDRGRPTAGTTWRWCGRRRSGRSRRWWWSTRSTRRCAAPPTPRTGWPPRC